jgi:anti-sigma regulatory factor (Ser/Thr protein kinase)
VAHVPPALAARVVLCADEATANAVQHAYGLQDAFVWVSARRTGDDLELQVRDEGHWREPMTQRRGRGLGLMSAFADEVEVGHDDEGTMVTLRWHA